MITAVYSHPENGTDYDQEQLSEFEVPLYQEFEVTKLEVHSWRTDVYLKGYEDPFNSVNFDIYEDGKELDYVNDPRFKSRW